MSEAASALRLNIVYVDPDEELEFPLGEVELDSQGMLSVRSAEPDYTEPVEEFVAEMNAKESFIVKVPPPPDAPRFQLYGETYDRSRSDFLDGLKQYAATYYSFRLLTNADIIRERIERDQTSL
jgi:hypothetical protein